MAIDATRIDTSRKYEIGTSGSVDIHERRVPSGLHGGGMEAHSRRVLLQRVQLRGLEAHLPGASGCISAGAVHLAKRVPSGDPRFSIIWVSVAHCGSRVRLPETPAQSLSSILEANDVHESQEEIHALRTESSRFIAGKSTDLQLDCEATLVAYPVTQRYRASGVVLGPVDL